MWNLPSVSAESRAFSRSGFAVVEQALSPTNAMNLLGGARTLIDRHGTHITREQHGLDYRVVPGDDIRKWLPSLFALYRDPALLKWLQRLTKCLVSTSAHLRSSININCLTKGQAYPWHRDAVAYSAVLFLSSLGAHDGGELRIERLDGVTENIRCTAGKLIVFDGHRCRHTIAPIAADTLRVTVPMVFPDSPAERPQGLDRYLYGAG